MRRCICCRAEAADILWQPFGPAETPTERTAFTWLDDHTRGFPALPLCDACHAVLWAGRPVRFRYKGQGWHCAAGTVTREETPPGRSPGQA